MKLHAPLLVTLTLVTCAAFISGCGRTRTQPIVLDDWPGKAIAGQPDDRPKKPAPGGQSETPALNVFQEGIASWYGSDYAGNLTASGERFDPRQLTAAHRTLPFNSRVRVTNTRNNRSIDVRINDRGPFVKGRVIDVSRAAAERLDMVAAGAVPVRLYLLERRGEK